MLVKVGNMAGKIWQTIGEKGEVNVSTLPRSLKQKGELVYQGLGWLARENKIQYKKKSGKTYVSLTPGETVAYDLYQQTKG